MLCPNWIVLCLVPVSEHVLSNQPQLAIAQTKRPVAVTTKRVWGVENLVSSLNNLPDMVTLLRLVGPHHNELSGVFKRMRLYRTMLVTMVH